MKHTIDHFKELIKKYKNETKELLIDLMEILYQIKRISKNRKNKEVALLALMDLLCYLKSKQDIPHDWCTLFLLRAINHKYEYLGIMRWLFIKFDEKYDLMQQVRAKARLLEEKEERDAEEKRLRLLKQQNGKICNAELDDSKECKENNDVNDITFDNDNDEMDEKDYLDMVKRSSGNLKQICLGRMLYSTLPFASSTKQVQRLSLPKKFATDLVFFTLFGSKNAKEVPLHIRLKKFNGLSCLNLLFDCPNRKQDVEYRAEM